MKKGYLWPIFRGILFLGQLFLQTLCTTFVARLNILPNKYLILFIAAMVLLAAFTGLLFFIKLEGKLDLWRKIIAIILAVLVIAGSGIVFKLATDFQNVVQTITTTVPDTRNTYIVVLQDNKANSAKDTKGYRYGVLEAYDEDHTQQMLEHIKQPAKK